MNKVVTFALVGAGERGLMRYAKYIESHPEEAKLVAVAEPREWNRNFAGTQHRLASTNVFDDWRKLAARERLADAVIIATQDSDHLEPAIRFMELGYDVLLEKPMATNESDCRKIIETQKKTKVLFAVCHVLRYSPYFRKMHELVQSGRLGQISTVRHVEQVGYWHFAHSYVRGNWRNEKLASPVILAKCSHDFDILLYVLNKRCLTLSSFGELSHFHSGNKPSNATDRCLDCPLSENACPYSAPKFYFDRLKMGKTGWPLNVITNDISEAGIKKALREGPYGRCVYNCDNDVMDHQIVAMQFEDGITVDFTMTAFTQEERRITEIFGSHGELRGDSNCLTLKSFVTGELQEFRFDAGSGAGSGGHLGGDSGIMQDFIDAVRARDVKHITSGPEISLASHVMAFTAEKSRKSNGELLAIQL